MKRYLAIKTLPLMAVLALWPVVPAAASGDKTLPQFRLNSIKIAGVRKMPACDIPPAPAPTNTGEYTGGGAAGPRLDSRITVIVDGEDGRAEITFPKAEHGGAGAGFRSYLYVKFAAQKSSNVLSWAAVVCSGAEYLGYKGSSLRFRDEAADFTIKDYGLSLGPLKNLLGSTHPWLLAAGKSGAAPDLDRLCSADFPGRMSAYAVKALPPETDGFSFKYNKLENSLTVTWHK